MSSKLLKKELHRVIRQSIDKQQEGSGGKGKQQGKRAAKRAKRQQARPSAEERLAANLKYFARTTTTRGPAADFVAQVRAPPPPPPPAAAHEAATRL